MSFCWILSQSGTGDIPRTDSRVVKIAIVCSLPKHSQVACQCGSTASINLACETQSTLQMGTDWLIGSDPSLRETLDQSFLSS